MDVVELPSNKCLHNKLGDKRAARMLSALYETEKLCTPIFEDRFIVLNNLLV